MNRITLAASLALSLLVASPVTAQTPETAVEAAAAASDAFATGDRNGNEKLDLEEMRNLMARVFHQLDTNDDNVLQPTEQTAVAAGAGDVTLSEFMSATNAAFTAADKNGDGELSREENAAGTAPGGAP
jgi:Ca2+-binding EF-hand superfamily protein